MSCRPCQYRRGLIFGNHHCMHKFSTFTFSLVFQCQYGMVLELDGHLEIGAHVRSNLCYVACLSHLIRSQAVPNPFFSLRKDPFSILRAQHFLSYHSSTMVKILYCWDGPGPKSIGRGIFGTSKAKNESINAVHLTFLSIRPCQNKFSIGAMQLTNEKSYKLSEWVTERQTSS